MKTPDEIKKGLECCIPRDYESTCRKCPYSRDDSSAECIADLEKDALDYIQQLESHLAQVERERDAAVQDVSNAKWMLCHVCKNYYRPDPTVRHYACKVLGEFSEFLSPSDFAEEGYDPISFCSKFAWRGVCEENTHDQPSM